MSQIPIQISTTDIIPHYKRCSQCWGLCVKLPSPSHTQEYKCLVCGRLVDWKGGSVIAHMRISLLQLTNLIACYLNKKKVIDVYNSFAIYMRANILSVRTIRRYYCIFDRILLTYYLDYLSSVILDNEVEIDECHLFRPKKSFAPSRPYKNKAVWLLGLKQRKSQKFVIIPVPRRTKKVLIPLIVKYIKPGTCVYTDCYSVYVDNKKRPRQSKLESYGYIHYHVNHRYEFVDKLFKHVHTNSIERLWRDVRRTFRSTGITSLYLVAIARFTFHRQLSREGKVKLLIEGLMQSRLPELQELYNRFYTWIRNI